MGGAGIGRGLVRRDVGDRGVVRAGGGTAVSAGDAVAALGRGESAAVRGRA